MTMQPQVPPAGGPYLQAAVFCDQAIIGNDGVLTLVRVVDRVTQRAQGPGAPEAMQPLDYNLTAVIMLKAGKVRGSHQLTLWRSTDPLLERIQVRSQDVYLEGEADRGANVIVRFTTRFEDPGLYWFDVDFDGSLLTRMPFRVIYLRG